MADTLTLVRPVWADPRYIGLTNAWRELTPVSVFGSSIKIANNNPTRWALLVVLDGSLSDPAYMSPADGYLQSGIRLHPSAGPQFVSLTLFEFGPIVSGEWYLYSPGNASARAYETFTQ